MRSPISRDGLPAKRSIASLNLIVSIPATKDFQLRPSPLEGQFAPILAVNVQKVALGDMDVLDRHLLLAAASISFQSLDLRCEGARELVEGPLGAILPQVILDVCQAKSARGRSWVDYSIFHRQSNQCINFIRFSRKELSMLFCVSEREKWSTL